MKLIRYNSPFTTPLTQLDRWFREPWFSGASPLDRLAGLGERFLGLLESGDNLATDLYEDETQFHARFEVPGVTKEEISVKLDPDATLVVEVNRKKGEEVTERWFRRLSLPTEAKTTDIKAKLENGLLTVSVPKAEAKKPVTIDIS